MDPALKRRLLVVIIIVALVVIFVPIPFGHLKKQKIPKPLSQIPPAPSQQQMQPAKKLTQQQINTINRGFVPASKLVETKLPHTQTHQRAQHKAVSPKKVSHKTEHKKQTVKTPVESPVIAEFATGKDHSGSIVITQSDLIQSTLPPNIRQSNLSSDNVAISSVQRKVAIQSHIKKAKKMDKAWVAQLGSFKELGMTEDVVTKLRKSGYTAFSYQTRVNGVTYYRVYVGPFLHLKQAEDVIKQVRKKFRISGYIHPFDATDLE